MWRKELGSDLRPRRRSAAVADEGKSGLVLAAGLLLATHRFTPDMVVDGRKPRVALDRLMNLGDGKARGPRHGLGIDLRPAGDDDLIYSAAQRVAARGGEWRRQARRHHDAGCREVF